MGTHGAGESQLGCGVPVSHSALGILGCTGASLCHSRAHPRLCLGTIPLQQLGVPGAGTPMGHCTAGSCSPPCAAGAGAAHSSRGQPGRRRQQHEPNSKQMGLRWRPGPQGGHRQEPVKGCRQEAAGRDARGGAAASARAALTASGPPAPAAPSEEDSSETIESSTARARPNCAQAWAKLHGQRPSKQPPGLGLAEAAALHTGGALG